MRTVCAIGALLGVTFGIVPSLAQAQDTPGVVLVADWQVTPGKEAEFVEAREAAISHFSENGFPHSQTVWWNAEDNLVRFSISMDSWADVAEVEQWFGTHGAPPSADGVNEASNQVSMSIWRPQSNLSYTPENPRLQAGEAGYIREIRFTLRPGTNQEAAAILQQMQEVNRRHGIQVGRFVTFQFAGTEGPVIVLFSGGRDREDLAEQTAADTETMGDEIRSLRRQLSNLATKREFSHWEVRRDLTYEATN